MVRSLGMDPRIQWTEPKGTAVERAKLHNEMRLSAFILIIGSALTVALITPVVVRLASHSWHLLSSIGLGMIIGAVIGAYNAWATRFPSCQQKIELRPDGFTIRGTKKCSLPYDQLRGYSIIYPRVEGTRHRLLTLYPRETSGAFSIGIPPDVSNDAIRAVIADQVPFQTIIDEQALTMSSQFRRASLRTIASAQTRKARPA